MTAQRFVILKAFYPLVLGASSHYGMLIHTQSSIHFHLQLNGKVENTRGDILFFAIKKELSYNSSYKGSIPMRYGE